MTQNLFYQMNTKFILWASFTWGLHLSTPHASIFSIASFLLITSNLWEWKPLNSQGWKWSWSKINFGLFSSTLYDAHLITSLKSLRLFLPIYTTPFLMEWTCPIKSKFKTFLSSNGKGGCLQKPRGLTFLKWTHVLHFTNSALT